MDDLIGMFKAAEPLKLPRLPRGITGFDRLDAAHQTSERDFRAACFSAARHCDGIVVDPSHCQKRIACSYLAVTTERPLGPVSMLANCYYPLVAFVADGAYDRVAPEFIDDALDSNSIDMMDAQTKKPDKTETWLTFENDTQFPDLGLKRFTVHVAHGKVLRIETDED